MEQKKPAFSSESVHQQFQTLCILWWGLFAYNLLDTMVGGFSKWMLILSFPLIVWETVLWCILLYRQWKLLQGHGARTTPGKAVGFGFIPFFQFYWWFVAYAGLAEDTNRYLEQLEEPRIRMSFGLAIAYCVLVVVSMLLLFDLRLVTLISIPTAIIGYMLIVQQVDCVLRMLREVSE